MITTVTFTTWHSWMSPRWRQLQLLSVAPSDWRAKGVQTSQMTLKPFGLCSDQLYIKIIYILLECGTVPSKAGMYKVSHLVRGQSKLHLLQVGTSPMWFHSSWSFYMRAKPFFYPLVSLSLCDRNQKSTKKSKLPSYRTQTQPRLPFLDSIKTFLSRGNETIQHLKTQASAILLPGMDEIRISE